MDKFFRLFLTGILLMLIMAPGVQAQAPGTQGAPEDGNGYFDRFRSRLLSSVEEQKRLADENQVLKSQLIGLQIEVEQLEREILQLDPDFFKKQKNAGRRKVSGWLDEDVDARVKEAQEVYLTGRFMPIGDLQRLRELHLYDLQFRAQETALDYKSLKHMDGKLKEQRRPQIESLKSEINARVDKLRDLQDQIVAQQRAARNLPKRLKLLKMENQALMNRLEYLERLR